MIRFLLTGIGETKGSNDDADGDDNAGDANDVDDSADGDDSKGSGDDADGDEGDANAGDANDVDDVDVSKGSFEKSSFLCIPRSSHGVPLGSKGGFFFKVEPGVDVLVVVELLFLFARTTLLTRSVGIFN